MQMLSGQTHFPSSDSPNYLLPKSSFYGSIHANAFQTKTPIRDSFMQMLSNQRQLTLPHSFKCFPTKGNLHSPIRANAFRTKAPYTVPCEPCFPTKSNFHRSIHTNAFFKRHFSAAIEANALSNLSNFHLLSECYVISLGPSLACIFIKCRRPGSYPSRLQALRNCKYAEWHKEYRDLRLKPNTTRWRVV
ncbi:Uncharacterised protein [Salmonella enterica subsp. enterica serovar Typhi]|nr:Uncharacterised protein [Salmonella enterica subsp. enterica serovar Typhi]